jgi:hypothetical protein
MSTHQSKQPTHRAYAVTKRGDKTFWREIGAAWAHDDGSGSGGGPRRTTRQEFAFNCETMTCRPAG